MRVAIKRRVARTAAVALTCAVLAAGCGPSSGDNGAPAGCLKFQPCGGDVLGTWKLLGGCSSSQLLADLNTELQTACPGASASALDVDISGTVTFNADLTYSSNINETFSAMEMVPLSCTGFSTCTAVQSASPDSTLTCTGTATCACRVTGSPAGNETGTYTNSGSSLTMVGPDGTTNNGYCVESGRLHIMELNDSGAVLGDFVGQKQ